MRAYHKNASTLGSNVGTHSYGVKLLFHSCIIRTTAVLVLLLRLCGKASSTAFPLFVLIRDQEDRHRVPEFVSSGFFLALSGFGKNCLAAAAQQQYLCTRLG